MSSKHFVHDPTHLVSSALQSITYTNPNTAFDPENKVVYLRPDAVAAPKVSLISGGGSGHEPSFAAFVGPGLLSAAVAGTIFASPSAEQVRRCILERVETAKGVLVVVMNYTGDVLNFGMAVEKAKAAGLDVEMVVMGDDAGVGRAKGGKVGRRGIAGTVLIHKIAGALAAQGASLKDVHGVAQAVADNTVSIGSSLAHVHVPGRGETEEELKQDEIEIGMGIHNEPGSERTSADLTKTVGTMLKYMLDQNDRDRAFLKVSSSDETVLLVNNLGGVSVLEMGGITTEVVHQLEKDYGIKPVRILSGTFMTSLNGLGFSISLLKLTNLGVGKPVLELLDAPSEAAGWSAAVNTKTWAKPPSQTRDAGRGAGGENKPCGLELDPAAATKALNHALDKLITAEPDITHYDTVVGDGDCGIGLKRGAEGIQKHLNGASSQKDAALYLDKIIDIVEMEMDGTSGALYAIFLNALAAGLREQGNGNRPADAKVWANALDHAMKALSRYTPAKPGDRTLVDALAPFVEQLSSTGDVQKAAQAAEKGSRSTQGMQASLGRTVYIGGSGFEEVPDPGAYGLSQFLTGLAEALR
ncbi:Dihydroxyacetone kinase 1 [Lecanosticta acicola]|uniref:Dihydroxyacetone kinase 1 n=1 Tax=Lecanosticta acicola TaxID=111012 RepID=A0AAI8YRX2_9PEZI|nr:Dihydroxyacetone kinase 1 [Lecanosticta acicola]